MSNLQVTVAICTWNRCWSLEQTLEGFARLDAPTQASWSWSSLITIVQDRTDQVIRTFEGRVPVRRVFEAKPGLSHARNRAVSEARGDYIVWADDDVTVCREWLIEYVNAFRRWPTAAIFGGPIQPWFDGTPPAWLLEAYPTVAGVYAARDFGNEPVPLSTHVIPWGANYAVRATEQARHPYDPDLGYRPGRMIGWEETEVIQALLAEGTEGWWVPGAALRHHVPKHRQTSRSTCAVTSTTGAGPSVAGRNEIDKRLIFGRPRWLWKRVVESEVKSRLHRMWSRPEVWVEDLITSSESWGLLKAYTPKGEVRAR